MFHNRTVFISCFERKSDWQTNMIILEEVGSVEEAVWTVRCKKNTNVICMRRGLSNATLRSALSFPPRCLHPGFYHDFSFSTKSEWEVDMLPTLVLVVLFSNTTQLHIHTQMQSQLRSRWWQRITADHWAGTGMGWGGRESVSSARIHTHIPRLRTTTTDIRFYRYLN